MLLGKNDAKLLLRFQVPLAPEDEVLEAYVLLDRLDVTDAVQRAYSVAFQDGQIDLNFLILPGSQFVGFDNNRAVNTGANNAIGLYINHSQPVVAGFVATGPKIGVKVENTTTVDFLLPIYFLGLVMGFRKRPLWLPVVIASAAASIIAYKTVGSPWHVSIGVVAGVLLAVILPPHHSGVGERP